MSTAFSFFLFLEVEKVYVKLQFYTVTSKLSCTAILVSLYEGKECIFSQCKTLLCAGLYFGYIMELFSGRDGLLDSLSNYVTPYVVTLASLAGTFK